ncbi:MAG: 1-acyl-sn-glycerol-3-phosphate acyltransferase, partial [Actinomycetota bacterium]
ILRRLATMFLRLGKWDVDPQPAPSDPRYMLLAAPHTSFVDGFWMLCAAHHFGIKVKFVMKAKHLNGVFAPLRWMGAIPVEPGAGKGTTEALKALVEDAEAFALLIAPSGSRSYDDRWRSGFLHLARDTELPVYCSVLDYGRRRIALSADPIDAQGDVAAVMDRIRDFYDGALGRKPEQTSVIVLKEEAANTA